MVMPCEQRCPKCGSMFMGSDCIGGFCPACQSIQQEEEFEKATRISVNGRGDFEHLDHTSFPVLVLGIKYHNWMIKDNYEQKYTFRQGREWKTIAHQTAGHACHQHYMIGTILKPKNVDILQSMNELTSHWLNSDCGVFGVGLEDINLYERQLQRHFGLTCNFSYRDFEEGIYPIDCTPEALKKMAEDPPSYLDGEIIWENDLDKIAGSINRWRLWILGKNCD